jgi:putative hydrolase of the HAD superfamily
MANLKRAGIIFDFDDTLVYFHEQFLLAERAFVARMTKLGLYDEDVLPTMREHDIDNVRRAGYLAAECFPLAFVQTYESYCGKYNRPPDANEKHQLLLLGRQPYISPPREMEGARELLRYLRLFEDGKRPLILFTQGEFAIQQGRLNSCGLASMFDAIKIVPEKDDATLQVLLQEQHLEPALSWYVGNSLRADINPAIRAGLNAVHLAKGGWTYEDEEPCGFYHKISRLEQFAVLLHHAEVAR